MADPSDPGSGGSGTVVAFNPLINLPHVTGRALCVDCRHGWVATAPFDTRNDWLECPSCHRDKGHFTGAYYPSKGNSSTFRWVCICGNDIFYILTGGAVLCPNCGAEAIGHL